MHTNNLGWKKQNYDNFHGKRIECLKRFHSGNHIFTLSTSKNPFKRELIHYSRTQSAQKMPTKRASSQNARSAYHGICRDVNNNNNHLALLSTVLLVQFGR